MKSTLLRNAQGKSHPGMPLDIEVGPAEGRTDYKCPANCAVVWPVAATSIQQLVDRKLVLESQRADKVFVCSCLGAPVSEETFPDMLESHLSTWGPHCGAPLAVYQGHLERLLEAHVQHIRTSDRSVFMPTLERPLVSWDSETTGVDPVLDRLVSLGVCVLNPDGTRRKWETLINPEMPIPPAVTEIHGITDEMAASAPKFRDIAQKFIAGMAGKDMLLYNGRRLDLPILHESLVRCGMNLDLTGVRIIDAAGLFFKQNPRDLSAFVKRYTGRDHTDAHGAAADSEGTLDGYLGMLAEHPELRAMTLEEQATRSMYGDDPDRLPCDLAGKLYLKNGEVYFGFGKQKDKRVSEDTGYAYWMLRCSDPPFPTSTREALQAELERLDL